VASESTEPAGARSQLGVLLATYVVLAAIGVLLGVIESFLVPLRLTGGLEGLSVVLALVGNLAVGLLGGIGTRTSAGAVAPIVGWFAAVGVLTTVSPGGDVVFAGKLPVDPGVVVVGMAFLLVGIFAGGVALVVSMRYTRRANAPTTLT
jgi:hypothetical protein